MNIQICSNILFEVSTADRMTLTSPLFKVLKLSLIRLAMVFVLVKEALKVSLRWTAAYLFNG